MSLGFLFKMCVVCVATITVASLLSPTTTPVVQNNITDYAITKTACPKSKVGKIENNKICLKDGKVYRWAVKIKPTLTPTPTPSATPTATPTPIPIPIPTPSPTSILKEEKFYNSLCDNDLDVPLSLIKYQNEAIKRDSCQPPYKFVSKKITTTPTTVLNNNILSSDQCKINPPIWNIKTSKWNPNYRIKVIPFQTQDYQTSSNPKEDWKDFFDYFSDTLDNMTDVKSNYVIDFEKNYTYIPLSLKSLNLGSQYMHGDPSVRPRTKKLAENIISVVDNNINFSNYDAIWFLPPRNISIDVLSNFIIDGPLYTNEKKFDVGIYLGTRYDDFESKKWNPRDPFGVMHEWLVHVSNSIDDTYGDYYSNNGVGHFGTGEWGNTSGAITDFLGFDKWQLGLIGNNQVLCLNPNQASTIWIKPLNYDGVYEKLAIIKLSPYIAISIQSMRSAGYNYKLPVKNNGVLVIDINAEKMYDNSVHADGQYVVCPNRNDGGTFHGGCKYKNLNDATLKLNESIIYKGYKITVVESGEFGDVVKVEKI